MTSDPDARPAASAAAAPAGPAGGSSRAPSRLAGPSRLAHPFSPGVLALVFAGGVLGALSRWALGIAIPAPGGWPLPTLLINLAGALALGVLLESLARRGPDVGARRLVRLTAGTGFLGAFTTYSTLAVDGAHLIGAGRAGDGAWYLGLSLLGGAAATLLGVAGAAWRHRQDRRGLAAEAHVAAHPHGGHPHPAPRGPARPAEGGPDREDAPLFGQNPGLRTGVVTEAQGENAQGRGDRTPEDAETPEAPEDRGEPR